MSYPGAPYDPGVHGPSDLWSLRCPTTRACMARSIQWNHHRHETNGAARIPGCPKFERTMRPGSSINGMRRYSLLRPCLTSTEHGPAP
jgi:hypothetical protein